MNSEDGQHAFRTTRWSVVKRATGSDDIDTMQALSALCEAYWYPIYAYFRRAGKNCYDAEDLTQGFFVHVLKRETFAGLSC